MSGHQPYQTYKQNAAETASPGELTLMLYNGCLKYIKLAKKAIANNQIEEKNVNILKAQDIVRELMLTLNMEQDISGHMLQMYEYMLHRLIESNTHNDVDMLNEVEGHVLEFRDTWKEVIRIHRKQRHGEGSA